MLREYVAERLPAHVFVPLGTGLALAAQAGGTWRSAGALAADAAMMTSLVALYRAWDDLADRHRDALTHPHRVLVRARSVAPVRGACLTLGAVAATVLGFAYPNRAGLLALLALTCGMAIWYTHRREPSAAGDHVLLAKYPALVLVVAIARGIDRPAVLAASAAVVYLTACLYEAIHDPASPSAQHRALIAIEAVLLVLCSAAVAVVLGASS